MQEAIEPEVKKLKPCGFIRKEYHPNWLANVVPLMKKNGKDRAILISEIWMMLTQKIISHFQLLM